MAENRYATERESLEREARAVEALRAQVRGLGVELSAAQEKAIGLLEAGRAVEVRGATLAALGRRGVATEAGALTPLGRELARLTRGIETIQARMTAASAEARGVALVPGAGFGQARTTYPGLTLRERLLGQRYVDPAVPPRPIRERLPLPPPTTGGRYGADVEGFDQQVEAMRRLGEELARLRDLTNTAAAAIGSEGALAAEQAALTERLTAARRTEAAATNESTAASSRRAAAEARQAVEAAAGGGALPPPPRRPQITTGGFGGEDLPEPRRAGPGGEIIPHPTQYGRGEYQYPPWVDPYAQRTGRYRYQSTRPGAQGDVGGSTRLNDFGAAAQAADQRIRNLNLAEEQLRVSTRNMATEMSTASTAMHRHGAITSEFIMAAARGETTLREVGQQALITAGKFGAWTAAATAVYAVVGALGQVTRGALDAQAGTFQLRRVISDVGRDQPAQTAFRDLSRQFNVPIATAADAVYRMGQIFHNQADAVEAARAALYSYKTGEVDVATSTQNLTAIVQGFGLTAGQLTNVYDQINQAQNTFGIRIGNTEAGLAKAAGTWRSAGGDLSFLLALFVAISRATNRSGQEIGTALARSQNFLRQASNQQVLIQQGITPDPSNIQRTYQQAFRAARRPGADVYGIAAGLVGPQYARLLTSVLKDQTVFNQAVANTSPERSKGSAQRELAKVLKQWDEQLKAVGNDLQRVGVDLQQIGAFDAFGVAIRGIRLMLSLVENAATAVEKVQGALFGWTGPLQRAVTYALELVAALAIMRRTGIGPALAQRFPTLQPILTREPYQRERALAIRGLRTGEEAYTNLREQATRQAYAATAELEVIARRRSEVERDLVNAVQRTPYAFRTAEQHFAEMAALGRQSERYQRLERQAGLPGAEPRLVAEYEEAQAQTEAQPTGRLGALRAQEAAARARALEAQARAEGVTALARQAEDERKEVTGVGTRRQIRVAERELAAALRAEAAAATEDAAVTERVAEAKRKLTRLRGLTGAETYAMYGHRGLTVPATMNEPELRGGVLITEVGQPPGSTSRGTPTRPPYMPGPYVGPGVFAPEPTETAQGVAQAERGAGRLKRGQERISAGLRAFGTTVGEVGVSGRVLGRGANLAAGAAERAAAGVTAARAGLSKASTGLAGLGAALGPLDFALLAGGLILMLREWGKSFDDQMRDMSQVREEFTGATQTEVDALKRQANVARNQLHKHRGLFRGLAHDVSTAVSDVAGRGEDVFRHADVGAAYALFAPAIGLPAPAGGTHSQKQREEWQREVDASDRRMMQEAAWAQQAARGQVRLNLPAGTLARDLDRSQEDFRNGLLTRRQYLASLNRYQAEFAALAKPKDPSTGKTEEDRQRLAEYAQEYEEQRRLARQRITAGFASQRGLQALRSYRQSLLKSNLPDIADQMETLAGTIQAQGASPDLIRKLATTYDVIVEKTAGDPTQIKALNDARSRYYAAQEQFARDDLQVGLAGAGSEQERRAVYARVIAEYNRRTVGHAKAAQEVTRRQLFQAIRRRDRAFAAYQAAPEDSSGFQAAIGVPTFGALPAPTKNSLKEAYLRLRVRVEQLKRRFGADSQEVHDAERSERIFNQEMQGLAFQDAQAGRSIDIQAAQGAGHYGRALRISAAGVREALRRFHRGSREYRQAALDDTRLRQQDAQERVDSWNALRSASAGSDQGAQLRVAVTNARASYESAKAAGGDPRALRNLWATYVKSQTDLSDYLRDQANSVADLGFQIAEARDHNNAAAQAVDRMNAANYDLAHARTPNDRQQALLAKINAGNDIADTAADRVAAQYEYLSAGTQDPVQQARYQVAGAAAEMSRYAQGTAEWYRAAASLRTGNQALRDAISDRTQARFEYLEAGIDDPVRRAHIETQAALAAVSATPPGSAARIRALATVRDRRRAERDARLQSREDDIEFALSMERITTDTAVHMYRNLLKAHNLTKATRRQILQRIHDLQKDEDQGEVELNVGNIRLPTLYDVRRLRQVGLSGPGQTRYTNTTVHQSNTFHVHGATDPEAVGYHIGKVLGTHAKAAARAAGLRG